MRPQGPASPQSPARSWRTQNLWSVHPNVHRNVHRNVHLGWTLRWTLGRTLGWTVGKSTPPANAPPENAPPENARPENAPPENAPRENAPPENAPPEKAPPKNALVAQKKGTVVAQLGFRKTSRVYALRAQAASQPPAQPPGPAPAISGGPRPRGSMPHKKQEPRPPWGRLCTAPRTVQNYLAGQFSCQHFPRFRGWEGAPAAPPGRAVQRAPPPPPTNLIGLIN